MWSDRMSSDRPWTDRMSSGPAVGAAAEGLLAADPVVVTDPAAPDGSVVPDGPVVPVQPTRSRAEAASVAAIPSGVRTGRRTPAVRARPPGCRYPTGPGTRCSSGPPFRMGATVVGPGMHAIPTQQAVSTG